jgi:hypothetical protein
MSDDLVSRAARVTAEYRHEFEQFRANVDRARAGFERQTTLLTDFQVKFLCRPRRQTPQRVQLRVLDGGRQQAAASQHREPQRRLFTQTAGCVLSYSRLATSAACSGLSPST